AQRLGDLASALDVALASVLGEDAGQIAAPNAATALAALVRATNDVGAHADAGPGDRLAPALEMLPRLAQWLGRSVESRGRAAPPRTLGEAARDYVEDGAFVEWARKVVCGAALGEPVARPIARLLERVREAREA